MWMDLIPTILTDDVSTKIRETSYTAILTVNDCYEIWL